MQLVTRLLFGQCTGELDGSVRHTGQKRGLLAVRPAQLDKCRAHDGGRKVRLHHQATAQRLKNHGNVKAGATKAAIVLREQSANGAQFGKTCPQVGADAHLLQ